MLPRIEPTVGPSAAAASGLDGPSGAGMQVLGAQPLGAVSGASAGVSALDAGVGAYALYNPDEATIYTLSFVDIAEPPAFALAQSADFHPIASPPVAAWRNWDASPASIFPPSDKRFATEHRITPADDPVAPNRVYEGRILDPGIVSASISLSAIENSDVESRRGAVRLANADGALDQLAGAVIEDGARVQMTVGPRNGYESQYRVIATSLLQQADAGLEDILLVFRSEEALADAVMPAGVYAGTGGAEGPAGLAGTQKPRVIGSVFNMAPVLVDGAAFIFQAHDGPLTAVSAVRFGGASMVFSGNVTTFAALQSTAVATGEYKTCLALGMIKVGLTQGGTGSGFIVTADVAAAAGAAAGAAEVMKALVVEAAAATGMGVATASFDALIAARPGRTYGAVIAEPTRWRDAISSAARSAGAYWGVDRFGEITAAVLLPPVEPPVLAIQPVDVIEIDRLGLPQGFQRPHASVSIRYRRNWSPLSSVAAVASAAGLSAEWRITTVDGPYAGPFAVMPPAFESGLQDEATAALVAGEMLTLHGVQRMMVAVTIPIAMMSPVLTDVVRVSHPRFGLSAGKLFRVVALTENHLDGTVALTLWG